MNENCLENIPYASSIAFILLLFGCGVFSGTIWEGADRVEKLFNDRFFKIKETEFLRGFGVAYAIITLIIGAIILVFGSLTSGNTRMKIYQSLRCHNLGRCSAALLIGACYLLLIGWLLFTCGGMVVVTIWVMVSKVCYRESAYWAGNNLNKDAAKFTYSFNLSNYGIYRPGPSRINTAGGFQEFCSEISSIGPLFTVAFICSIVVVWSLMTYISALASNLVRLKYHPELARFRQVAHSSLADISDPLRATNSLVTHSSFPDQQSATANMYASQSMEMQPLTAALAPSTTTTSYHPYGGGGQTDINGNRHHHLPPLSHQYHNQYHKYDRQPNNSLV